MHITRKDFLFMWGVMASLIIIALICYAPGYQTDQVEYCVKKGNKQCK